MASQMPLRASKLLDLDICDRGVCSEEGESGEFVNSATSLSDGYSAFQQWRATDSVSANGFQPSDTSSPTPVQQVPDLPGIPGTDTADCDDLELYGDNTRGPRASIVDGLLVELYETYSGGKRGYVDSLDSSTEASSSEAFLGRSNTGSNFLQELQEKHTRRHQMNYLAQKAPEELCSIIQEVKYRTGLQSAKLLRQLKRRDRLRHKRLKNCDVITACLQAVSQKRRKGNVTR
ncbi:unnamed protein product [Boreogadus saida]